MLSRIKSFNYRSSMAGMEAKLMELDWREKKTRAMKLAMIQELLAGRTLTV
jgi:hypothetical protein